MSMIVKSLPIHQRSSFPLILSILSITLRSNPLINPKITILHHRCFTDDKIIYLRIIFKISPNIYSVLLAANYFHKWLHDSVWQGPKNATVWKVFVFIVFQAPIILCSEWIQRFTKSPYSVRIQNNMDQENYGPFLFHSVEAEANQKVKSPVKILCNN